MAISPNNAEAVALQALAFLVADEDLLPVFQGSSGASADDLRAGATDPAFLASVLDFILMDDAWVMRFCDTVQLPYETVMQARHGLPGGEMVNWT